MLELVDGLRIVSVLVVDDTPDQVKSVIDSLRARGCAVTHCTSQEAASNFLSSAVAFDLVVLDWHLDADNSKVAALVLADILDYCFVPVAVWTKFVDEAQEELDEGKYEFPRDMILAWDKEIGAEGLQEEMIQWLDANPQARLALLWSRSVRLSLSDPIRRLQELQGEELGSLAQYVWSKGFSSPRLAGEALLELLQSLLSRKLQKELGFVDRVAGILESQRELGAEMSTTKFADFRSVEMYSVRTEATTIRTGDIIDGGGEPWEFAVVLTPACDLAHASPESDHLFVARALELQERFGGSDKKSQRKEIVGDRMWRYQLLPFVPLGDAKIHLIVDFQDVKACLVKDAQDRIKDGGWKIIATVESPYREHALQRYSSSMGRIGIPALPGYVNEWLTGD